MVKSRKRGDLRDFSEERRVATCVGCGREIFDRFILRVAPDLEWHAACLKCSECQQFLDESHTCFVREGKTYCKRDYTRLFGAKCAKCQGPFGRNDYVMRARSKIFHLDCFSCLSCSKALVPGEEFALTGENLYCKFHYEEGKANLNSSIDSCESFKGRSPLSLQPVSPAPAAPPPTSRAPSPPERICPSTPAPLGVAPNSVASSSGASSSSSKGQAGGSSDNRQKRKEQKTTRVRTVLNEKQLLTLRTCYNANPRPDALMKEQLVEMTSLSPRVIRVWFQNKRCKDKKRSILVKQMQQHQEKTSTLNAIRLQGVGPLVAETPGRHEIPLMQPVEIGQFQQSSALWKLSDFGPLQDSSLADPNSTPFQQLVESLAALHNSAATRHSHVTSLPTLPTPINYARPAAVQLCN